MKGSGITRKIDELGRIVVPKEMRYNLGIRDGEPLEIYIENNKIVIEKYSEIDNIKLVADSIIKLTNDILNIDIMITDRDRIISATNNINYLINNKLSNNHKLLIDERLSYISKNKELMYDLDKYFYILPIITINDCSGLVIIINDNYNEEYINYGKIISKIISNKLEGKL